MEESTPRPSEATLRADSESELTTYLDNLHCKVRRETDVKITVRRTSHKRRTIHVESRELSYLTVDDYNDINKALPEEVMVQVFLQLHDDPSDLCTSALVCRRWGAILRDNFLWKHLCQFKDFRLIPDDAKRQKLRCRCTSHRCGGGEEAFAKGKKRCDVVWRGVRLTPWKAVYKQNHLTYVNWMTGKYKLRHVFGNTNALCLGFTDDWAVLVTQELPGSLMNLKTGEVHMLLEGHFGIISAVKILGDRIMTGGVDNTAKVWDINRKECVLTLLGHQGEIVSVQFNTEIYAAASEDCTVRVWDAVTARLIHILKGHRGAVCSLIINDWMIVSGSVDHSIRVWSWKEGKCLRVMRGHNGYVYCIQQFGSRLCSGASDGLIKIWDIATGKCLRSWVGHDNGVVCLQYDGSKIVSGGSDYTVKVWCPQTGSCRYTLNHHSATIWNLNCIGSKLMTSSFDTSLLMFDFGERILDDGE